MDGKNGEDSAEALIAELKAAGVEPTMLDELVLDLAGDASLEELNGEPDAGAQEVIVEDTEEAASRINNGSLEEQVPFIIRVLGEEKAEEAIREASGL